ncbi:MAG: UDP-3-O-[3-hydroxymyristoyl] N-acetylglucosamine deacetylase [Planctomycetes bacterium]|nr:UDP-3-O-[3-hydroxymyristoyl] N-acetylglucosamine deacetylase [Planctomycetota bacterium]MCW8135652.1 UDP-3-O-[3-hydroxymyristoyl] N-acetylglucosamine deacetylase [Planctomycetota bacterium]
MAQTTLASPVSMTGTSLHEGHPVTLTLKPAPADAGITLVRVDKGGARIAVHPRNIREVQRRTVLAANGAEVHTVEHVLAALYGMGVDNCELELTAPEPPAGDGSSRAFVKMIREAGITQLAADRPAFTPAASIRAGDDKAWVSVEPGDGLTVEYTLDYGVPFMPISTVRFAVTPETFERDIGPARTFCLEQEAKMLQAMGFGKGANTQNTLVVGPGGPLDNTLRFADEYARHKLLDVIGDLAVTGLRLNATVKAHRSGHSQNQQVAKALREQYDGAR